MKKKGIFFVGILFVFLISLGSALTYINSCQTLSTAGETYILQNDVNSDGTCFVIDGPNIIFNLNGHTVTYGANPPWVDNCRGYHAPVSGYICSYGISVSGSADNVTLTNGSVTQAPGDILSYGEPVRLRGYNPDVSFLKVTYHANDTGGIEMYWAGGGKIYNNLVISNSTYISYRMDGRAGIDMMRNAGNGTIYNNTILGVPHLGIRVYQLNTSYGANFKVYDNYVRANTTATNGYGVTANVYDSEIYNNRIEQINGPGIHATYCNISIYGNFINVTHAPNSEYGTITAHGIKIEDSYCNGTIYNNTIYAYAYAYGNGAAAALDLSPRENAHVRIFNNTLYAFFPLTRTPSRDNFAAPVHVLYDASNNVNADIILYNNTMISNYAMVYIGYDVASNYNFLNNRFILTTPTYPQSYFIYFFRGPAINYYFTNNTYEGISFRNSYLGGDNEMNYTVDWFLDTVVQTFGGIKLSGANVVIRDNLGNQQSATTDSSGTISRTLPEFYRYHIGATTTDYEYNNYNVTVTYLGQTQSRLVTLNHSLIETFYFGGKNPDVNGDGFVNVIDLAIVIFNQGRNPVSNPNYAHLDLNEDGSINFDDVKLVMNYI